MQHSFQSYEDIEKETRLSFQQKFNISNKATELRSDLVHNEQWSKSRDMKMVPRQRFAYGMALVGTAFFIILVKEVNNPGGYFYRDQAFQGWGGHRQNEKATICRFCRIFCRFLGTDKKLQKSI